MYKDKLFLFVKNYIMVKCLKNVSFFKSEEIPRIYNLSRCEKLFIPPTMGSIFNITLNLVIISNQPPGAPRRAGGGHADRALCAWNMEHSGVGAAVPADDWHIPGNHGTVRHRHAGLDCAPVSFRS